MASSKNIVMRIVSRIVSQNKHADICQLIHNIGYHKGNFLLARDLTRHFVRDFVTRALRKHATIDFIDENR